MGEMFRYGSGADICFTDANANAKPDAIALYDANARLIPVLRLMSVVSLMPIRRGEHVMTSALP